MIFVSHQNYTDDYSCRSFEIVIQST